MMLDSSSFFCKILSVFYSYLVNIETNINLK